MRWAARAREVFGRLTSTTPVCVPCKVSSCVALRTSIRRLVSSLATSMDTRAMMRWSGLVTMIWRPAAVPHEGTKPGNRL